MSSAGLSLLSVLVKPHIDSLGLEIFQSFFRANGRLRKLSGLSKTARALGFKDLLRKPWKILLLLSLCQVAIIPSSGKEMSLMNCNQESVPQGLASDSPGIPVKYQEVGGEKAGHVQHSVSILSYVMINYACCFH